MRTFLATHWKSIVVLIVLVLLAVFAVPARSGNPPLAVRLHARADAVARHTAGPAGLDGAARYIAATLAAQGYQVRQHGGATCGSAVRHIEAWHSGSRAGQTPLRSFILAARYGSLDDDELAATAAMLELARLLKGIHPAPDTEIRFVFLVGRSVPAQAPFGSFVAYAGPRGALGRVSETLAFFRNPPEGAAGALAAPAWVQGVTLGHLPGGGAMLVADIGTLHSSILPAGSDAGRPDYKTIARMLRQLAQSVSTLAGVTNS